MLENRKKRRNRVFLILFLVLVGGAGAGAYFALKGGNQTALDTTPPVVDVTTPNATVSPSSLPSDTPSSSPTELVYDPPSEEDCKRLSDGLPPLDEESMFTRNFHFPLEIGFASMDTDPANVIPELEEKITMYLIPRIVGCPLDEQRRLEAHDAGTSRRQLRNIRYMIADAKVQITLTDGDCAASNSAKRNVVRASLTVKLRGDERNYNVILFLGEYFEKDKNLSDDLNLSTVIDFCIRSMDVQSTDPTSSTLAPSSSPSGKYWSQKSIIASYQCAY